MERRAALIAGGVALTAFILYELTMQPRGIRNNNPGNLRPRDSDPLDDYIGVSGEEGGYLKFFSSYYGLRAAARNLRSYAVRHGIYNLQGVAMRWAPKSENDTADYIRTLSQVSGFSATQPLQLTDPETCRQVLKGIVVSENGYKFLRFPWYSDAEIDRAVNSALELSRM